MIVDFHAHVFPDHLAARALAALLGTGTNPYIPMHDCTIAGLLKNMDNWGIDISVNLPVITKLSQVTGTNEWAASICSERLVSFGGLYPNSDDWKKDIDHAVGLGLKGLKLHPEYQDFLIDDDRMFEVYDYALGKGLILLFHAGFDPDFLPPFKSSPRQFARIVKAMRGGIIIAAHLGGHDQWDDVEEYLAGTNIYLDTSMGFEYYPHEQFMRIVKNHGADKILFASDSPWSNAQTELEHIRALPLTDEDKAAILGGNAMRILGI